jgi:UDP-glucuronate 4-epimerase
MPFSEDQGVDHPLQFYAATKRANELMAHSYSHLFRLPTSGLRFFTVYRPWGRPDMALFLFTKNILAGKPIKLFNNGQHIQDFTYVDDIVEGVVGVSDQIARPDPDWNSNSPNPATSNAPFRSSTLVIAYRSTSQSMLRRSSRRSAGRHFGSSCLCNWVTFRTPVLTWAR